MRWILAALLITMSAAHAQTSTPGASTSASPPAVSTPATPAITTAAPKPHRTHHTLQERFDTANTTHDGHLTLEQARAKMPSVARDFDAIDTDHKGFVTLDQIKAHSKAVRAEKRAAKKAAKEQH
jgi:hypothetical protein